jgi:hypothetical protein
MSDHKMTDPTADRRALEFKGAGLDMSHAFGLASFEERVESWPSEWGADFVALVFGDFNPPDKDLAFESLGIIVEPNNVEGTIIKTAMTVLKARVRVPEKTVAAVKDASRRLNLLVGVLSSTNRGAPIRWWSYITSPSGGGIGYTLGANDPSTTLALIQLLPPKPQASVSAALYWIREPRGMLLERHQSDEFAVYAGYWNAFECLVKAGNALRPRRRPSQEEQTCAIAERLASLKSVGPKDIKEICREVVEPGFRAEAAHTLHTWLRSFLCPMLYVRAS